MYVSVCGDAQLFDVDETQAIEGRRGEESRWSRNKVGCSKQLVGRGELRVLLASEL